MLTSVGCLTVLVTSYALLHNFICVLNMGGFDASGMLSMDKGICVYVPAVLSFRFFWNN
jgi:hypothetical protein